MCAGRGPLPHLAPRLSAGLGVHPDRRPLSERSRQCARRLRVARPQRDGSDRRSGGPTLAWPKEHPDDRDAKDERDSQTRGHLPAADAARQLSGSSIDARGATDARGGHAVPHFSRRLDGVLDRVRGLIPEAIRVHGRGPRLGLVRVLARTWTEGNELVRRPEPIPWDADDLRGLFCSPLGTLCLCSPRFHAFCRPFSSSAVFTSSASCTIPVN